MCAEAGVAAGRHGHRAGTTADRRQAYRRRRRPPTAAARFGLGARRKNKRGPGFAQAPANRNSIFRRYHLPSPITAR
jgi:hypothetical protein